MRYLSQPRNARLLKFLCTALLLGSCGSPRAGQAAGTEPVQATALDNIARLKDQRSAGAGALLAYLQNPDPSVRQRAALAPGRLPLGGAGAHTSAGLLQAQADVEASVRAEVWFALGQLADPAAIPGMLVAAASSDEDALVQAAAVHALGAFDEPSTRAFVIEAMRSERAAVRAEAAAESFHWSTESADAAAVDVALAALVRTKNPGK